jgi:hypothetical protein
MRRLGVIAALVAVTVLVGAPIAHACGFLVSENGAVRLGRTTTFVTWEDGIERYITNFSFEGVADSFGSIIPLPAEPSDVSRAGDWTLQRLQIEVARENPLLVFGASKLAFEARDAEVILQTTIDSLDVVVLKGGAAQVLTWVNENGFDLPEGPATDHMLQFYASRSPYFLAARFDAERAEQDDFVAGDGIPVQITMPTPRPWIPLHILHGAQPDTSIINADIFLLTPDRPNLLHGEGLEVNVSQPADDLLLSDLRSDENMEWIPDQGWFTHLILETDATNLTYDLSVGVGGTPPSFVDAGFTRIEPTDVTLRAFGLQQIHWTHGLLGLLLAAVVGGVVVGWVMGRPSGDVSSTT